MRELQDPGPADPAAMPRSMQETAQAPSAPLGGVYPLVEPRGIQETVQAPSAGPFTLAHERHMLETAQARAFDDAVEAAAASTMQETAQAPSEPPAQGLGTPDPLASSVTRYSAFVAQVQAGVDARLPPEPRQMVYYYENLTLDGLEIWLGRAKVMVPCAPMIDNPVRAARWTASELVRLHNQ